MAKRTLKEKTFLFSGIFFLIVTAVSACVCLFSSRNAFRTNTSQRLQQTANTKLLEFDSGLNGQIVLVLQMTKSPVIREYLKHPGDSGARESALAEFAAYKDSFLGKTVFWVSSQDLRFWSDLAYSYTVNPDNSDDYWYKMTVEQTDVYNFNINYNKELKRTMLWLNAVVRDENGRAIGMAGTGIPLTGFVDQMYSSLDSSVTMYLYNGSGEITGARDASLIEQKAPVAQYLKGITIPDTMPDKLTAYHAKNGEYVLCPITSIGWTIALFSPYNTRMAFSGRYLLLSLLIMGIALLFIVTFDFFIIDILASMSTVLNATRAEAAEQADFISGVTATLKENVGTIDQFGSLMNSQAGAITESGKKTEDLLGRVSALDRLRSDSQNDITELDRSSQEGGSRISGIADKVADLAECTKRLTNANTLISGITSRTNLLAMNASIEAAHAGAQGVGFAVVAKEIRTLAEKSRTQQQDVAKTIADMTGMVEAMVASSATAKSSFEAMAQNTARVQENFRTMSRNIEESNSLGGQITGTLQEINAGMGQITAQFSTMRGQNEDLVTEVNTAAEKSLNLEKAAEAILKTTGVKPKAAGTDRSGKELTSPDSAGL